MSGILAMLSIFFAILLFAGDLLLLAYYSAFSAIILVAVYFFKKQILYAKMTRSGKYAAVTGGETQTEGVGWNVILAVICGLIVLITVPFFLARLYTYVWIVFLLGFTTGMSISEIALYVYM